MEYTHSIYVSADYCRCTPRTTAICPPLVEKKKEEEKEEEKEVQDIPMTFPRSQLRMVKELGMGDFGKVIQCEARKLVAGQKKTTVVVKVG